MRQETSILGLRNALTYRESAAASRNLFRILGRGGTLGTGTDTALAQRAKAEGNVGQIHIAH